MPDDNRFAGLGEAVEEPDEDQGQDQDENQGKKQDEDQNDREVISTDDTTAGATEASASGAEPGTNTDSPAENASTEADATESESAGSPGVEAEPDDAASVPPREAGPAFEFDDTSAKSIYVREETLQILEDTEFEVEMLLRREHDVRDVTGREFHDAAVRVLESYPEEIVSAILDARESQTE